MSGPRITTTALPWGDCKVAFDAYDEDAVWAALSSSERRGKRLRYALPRGWELNGTDGAGARVVAVFRVNVLLRKEDGEKVRTILDKIDARAKEAYDKSEARVRKAWAAE